MDLFNHGPISVLDPATAPMPENLLGVGGVLKLLPAATYDACHPDGLRLWCHKNARYGLPTRELIEWLKAEIGERKAIEIGAGHGDLAYHLGVCATDSWNQAEPQVRAYYAATGQPVIEYPKWVEKRDAHAAIRKYKPEVVVASWVTQWADPRGDAPPGGGSIYGIKEEQILDKGITYILIGNHSVHGQKRIMARPHEELELPFLRSRSAQ